MSYADTTLNTSLKSHFPARIEFQQARASLNKVRSLDKQALLGAAAKNIAVPQAHHTMLVVFTFLWAGNFVLAEAALRYLSPIAFSVSRFLVAAVVLLAIQYFQGKAQAKKDGVPFRLFPPIARADWPRLVAVAVLGATLAPWVGIEGLHMTSSGRASLWLAMCPVLSAGLGYFMRTETMSKAGLFGLAIAGIGTVGLTADGVGLGNSYWLGDLLLLSSICFTIVELHLIKPLVSKYGSTPIVAARTSIGGTFYLLIASASLVEQPWFSLNSWTWVAILFGGAVVVGCGQWIKVRALNALGPTRVVLYGNLVPPVTLLLAWLTLGSSPTLLEIVAGALIIFGAICIQVIDPHRPDQVARRG